MSTLKQIEYQAFSEAAAGFNNCLKVAGAIVAGLCLGDTWAHSIGIMFGIFALIPVSRPWTK